jgi:hypothetical protein
MKDLKNKFTEEEFRYIIEDYLKFDYGCSNDDCPEGIDLCLDCYILRLKQSGIIRKSVLEEAREKTDRYIDEIIDTIKSCDVYHMGDKYKLKQLIQAERQAADIKE